MVSSDLEGMFMGSVAVTLSISLLLLMTSVPSLVSGMSWDVTLKVGKVAITVSNNTISAPNNGLSAMNEEFHYVQSCRGGELR
jgi:hypothetical protein